MGKNKKIGGFSLIELLIAVGIISILSSLGYASFNTARMKAKDAKRTADVRQIEAGLALYFDDNRTYPASLDVLDDSANGGPFLSVVPTPPNGTGETSYRYATSPATGAHTNYHIGTTLEGVDNSALINDADFNSTTGGWLNGFDGASADVYDVRS